MQIKLIKNQIQIIIQLFSLNFSSTTSITIKLTIQSINLVAETITLLRLYRHFICESSILIGV